AEAGDQLQNRSRWIDGAFRRIGGGQGGVEIASTEVMVKRDIGFDATSHDWEFFFLDVSKDGTRINNRGTTDVVNQLGGNCFKCHRTAAPQWDLVCETDHGCAPLRGRDDRGQDLVIARDYIAHGIRGRAQDLVTLELGPETELERIAKRTREVVQERFTLLDRSLLNRAKEHVLVLTTADEADLSRHTLGVGRLKTLERMGLATEKRPRVRQLVQIWKASSAASVSAPTRSR